MTRHLRILLVASIMLTAINLSAAQHWGDPKDLGCVGAKRRFEARLWEIPWFTSWDAACKAAPNTIAGQFFSTPTKCETRGTWPFKEQWGIFDVTDPGCQPSEVSEGGLFRETSSPEVYLIYQGKKIWIPTPAALSAMGHNWGQVKVVPAGALASYPRFNIPSRSPTPGSLVYPPRQGHEPLQLPTTTRVRSRERDVEIVELFGWLRDVECSADCTPESDNGCGDGSDYHYTLELDTEWAKTQGIDLNRILRVGNVVHGTRLPGFTPRRTASLPTIMIELDSWGRSYLPPGLQKPDDWATEGPCGLTWPFPPLQPDPSKPALATRLGDLSNRGPYVRVSGSLITDSPHDVQHRPGVFLSRHFAMTFSDSHEWEASVPDWHPGVSSEDANHFARWTEVHPPDLIEVLPPKEAKITTRGVALAARTGVTFGIIGSCEEAIFDIYPEAQRPPNSEIAFEELRGPETYFPWGENSDNGSWITRYDDHVNVKARVCGGSLGGSPGRFKALYRVWWKPSSVTGSTSRYTAVWQPATAGEIQVYEWSYPDFKAKYDELWQQGWRLKLLSTHVVATQVRYTAVWQQSTAGEIQLYDTSYSTFRAKYDELWPQGWRLKLLSTHVVGGNLRYAAVWQPGTGGEIQLYNATYSALRSKYNELWPQGWRLKLLSSHVVGGQVRYTAVWQPSTEGEIQLFDASYTDFRAKYDELWPQGWRLKLLTTYLFNGQLRYSAVWRPSNEGEIQVYAWSYADFKAKYDQLWPQGWRLKILEMN